MVLKLYYDLRSQPCRAIYIMLKYCRVSFEGIEMDVILGDNLKTEFEKVNRFKRVPVIEHDGFTLTESVAIYQYLHQQGMISYIFTPNECRNVARVNEFLSWQHIGLRLPCTDYFVSTYIEQAYTGRSASEEKLKKLERRMSKALDEIENKWLRDDTGYLINDGLTAADVFACCEIEQTRMCIYDPTIGRPKLKAWLKRVRNDLNPHYDIAHEFVDRMAGSKPLHM